MKKMYWGLLVLSLYAGYLLFFQLLFGENELVAIKSQHITNYGFEKKDTLRNKQVINSIYLCFKLSEDTRIYTIHANIDSVKGGLNAFGGVKKALESAGEVTVWIRRAEISSIAPKVYQIFTDDEKVFEITKRPGNNFLLSLMLLATIFVSCTIYYYAAIYSRRE